MFGRYVQLLPGPVQHALIQLVRSPPTNHHLHLTILVIEVIIPEPQIRRVSDRLIILSARPRRRPGPRISNKVEASRQAASVRLAAGDARGLVGVKVGIVVEGIGAGQAARVADLGLDEDGGDCGDGGNGLGSGWGNSFGGRGGDDGGHDHEGGGDGFNGLGRGDLQGLESARGREMGRGHC